jgi:hypothetical protein
MLEEAAYILQPYLGIRIMRGQVDKRTFVSQREDTSVGVTSNRRIHGYPIDLSGEKQFLVIARITDQEYCWLTVHNDRDVTMSMARCRK